MYAVRVLYRDGSVVYWMASGGWTSDIAHAQIFYNRAQALRKARYERTAEIEGFWREERRKKKLRGDPKQAWSPRTYIEPLPPSPPSVDVVEIR